MDLDDVSREFLTAIRGKRSQVAWSRRLGYRSNVAYTWESGRRQPTLTETFRAVRRSGLDLRGGLEAFYGSQRPSWLTEHDDLTTPEATSAFLRDLKGRTRTSDLARDSGLSRYSLTRWLSGKTQPRLVDFLRYVDACTLRLVDFLTSFVAPEQIPSIMPLWRRLEARRAGAGDVP